jgi:hypothetical protein
MIPRRSRALILLGDNGDVFRGKLPCNRQRLVARAIINDNDLLALPGLPHR